MMLGLESSFGQCYKYVAMIRDLAISSMNIFEEIWREGLDNGISNTMSTFNVFEEYVANPLLDNLLQVCCYAILLYLVVVLQKENQVFSRLVKDLKVAKGLMEHSAWQVDEAESEMKALSSRLLKNETTRIPSIIGQLENIYKILDLKQENAGIIDRELSFLAPEVRSQVSKLRKLNEVLRMEVDDDRIRKIRNTGVYAANRINEIQDKLHSRIVEAKEVLEMTNTLMDIKGIPMRVEY